LSGKPKLDEIEKMLAKGITFSLTEAQYEKKTGARLPKDNGYLVRKSALAKRCEEYGYMLRLQEKVVYLEKRKSEWEKS